jgi:hypothetical protein
MDLIFMLELDMLVQTAFRAVVFATVADRTHIVSLDFDSCASVTLGLLVQSVLELPL